MSPKREQTGTRRASSQVKLVISCALLGPALFACSPERPGLGRTPELEVSEWSDGNSYTNNAYNPQRGYYHAHSQVWYPYPWGYHDIRHGYFYDGAWHRTARAVPETESSTPKAVAVARAGGQNAGGGSPNSSIGSKSSTHRGGFGGSGRSAVS